MDPVDPSFIWSKKQANKIHSTLAKESNTIEIFQSSVIARMQFEHVVDILKTVGIFAQSAGDCLSVLRWTNGTPFPFGFW